MRETRNANLYHTFVQYWHTPRAPSCPLNRNITLYAQFEVHSFALALIRENFVCRWQRLVFIFAILQALAFIRVWNVHLEWATFRIGGCTWTNSEWMQLVILATLHNVLKVWSCVLCNKIICFFVFFFQLIIQLSINWSKASTGIKFSSFYELFVFRKRQVLSEDLTTLTECLKSLKYELAKRPVVKFCNLWYTKSLDKQFAS